MGRKKARSPRQRAVRAVQQKLESLERAGVTHLPKPPPPAKQGPPSLADEGLPETDQRLAALAEVQRQVAACTRCKDLVRTRTQTVFGVGNPYARLVFVGEAPGGPPGRPRGPFVGAAGQLLNRILQACTLARGDVYICNILRCRPPGNRNPLPAEAANCREYLDRQLAIIQPEFICCLGTVAAQNLLGTTDSIGRLRGRFHDYQGIRVLCTYHPAYLLRTPSAKRRTWEDMQMLMAEMGIELPKK
jgi:uracil-DNA glycosylase family 4